MASYAKLGYEYPSASQLLGGGGVVGQSTAGTDIPQAVIPATNAPSPLSGANEASLSPSGGSAATAATTGPVSPGVNSQTSNNAGPGARASAVVDNSAAASSILGFGGNNNAPVAGTSCCENGRPIITNPVSGQTVCSCQYDTARLALSGYSRMPSTNVGVYGAPYPSTEQNPYPSIGVDSAAFYSPLTNPYSLKDSGAATDMTAWTSAGLQPTTSYYSYDPALAAYGYGAGYDLAARRKNATRESTATLKAWLNEHKKNPYPTKGEKIMLAIITKMTLTQVSTWFANARRRLKKENKMTWEPKNKTEDDDDTMLSDDEKEGKEAIEKPDSIYGGSGGMSVDHSKGLHHLKAEIEKDAKGGDIINEEQKSENPTVMRSLNAYSSPYGYAGYNTYQQHHPNYYQHAGVCESSEYNAPKNLMGRDCGIPIPATKPKIWSLADTVACKTPPPTSYPGQQYYTQHQQQQQQQQQLQLPQQQPPHLLPHLSSNRSNHSPNHMSLQPPHQEISAAPTSPLSMTSSYATISPYSRIPTTFGTSAFSSNTGTPTTPITPPSMSAHQHQYQQQQYQTPHQLQRMGFLEVQPDTPPQTPPNLKHSNAAHPLLAGPATALTTGMCCTSGVGDLNRPFSRASAGNDVNSSYAGIMTPSQTED